MGTEAAATNSSPPVEKDEPSPAKIRFNKVLKKSMEKRLKKERKKAETKKQQRAKEESLANATTTELSPSKARFNRVLEKSIQKRLEKQARKEERRKQKEKKKAKRKAKRKKQKRREQREREALRRMELEEQSIIDESDGSISFGWLNDRDEFSEQSSKKSKTSSKSKSKKSKASKSKKSKSKKSKTSKKSKSSKTSKSKTKSSSKNPKSATKSDPRVTETTMQLLTSLESGWNIPFSTASSTISDSAEDSPTASLAGEKDLGFGYGDDDSWDSSGSSSSHRHGAGEASPTASLAGEKDLDGTHDNDDDSWDESSYDDDYIQLRFPTTKITNRKSRSNRRWQEYFEKLHRAATHQPLGIEHFCAPQKRLFGSSDPHHDAGTDTTHSSLSGSSQATEQTAPMWWDLVEEEAASPVTPSCCRNHGTNCCRTERHHPILPLSEPPRISLSSPYSIR